MSEWRKCYRLAHPGHTLEAKRAKGGEECGHGKRWKAKPGQWLCRNPENGHTWTMTDEGFDELYCEVGKPPKPKKQKKQEDGHRKGQSRHSSASNEADVKPDWGELFEERENEQQIEEEGGSDGDVV